MMTSINKVKPDDPQCQFFVVRKKRLCRMTVRPGRQFCGEHEPQPRTAGGEEDTRIPCPNDPKHTCYISKLEKHLTICNARQTEQPPYIVPNINAPADSEACPRMPLSQIPKEVLMQVIEKINCLYNKHVKNSIDTLAEHEIHSTVLEEFSASDRTESSRRHLRQASSLLHLMEDEGLVRDNTCYVELGAGKGQLSYYVCVSWCSGQSHSGAVLVDRAALRHKRDNKLPRALRHKRDDKLPRALRLRTDLAHLQLARVPLVQLASHAVGLAKHLCGVATDLAIRCVTADQVLDKTLGVVLATCCHHRCEQNAYVANKHLKELNISCEEFNVMLGIVSWATCGDGRSRDRRNASNTDTLDENQANGTDQANGSSQVNGMDQVNGTDKVNSTSQVNGMDQVNGTDKVNSTSQVNRMDQANGTDKVNSTSQVNKTSQVNETSQVNDTGVGNERLVLSQEYRAQVGRRAKQLIDWGRVLYLREKGFDARLCYFVPTSVSLENVCIIAKKPR